MIRLGKGVVLESLEFWLGHYPLIYACVLFQPFSTTSSIPDGEMPGEMPEDFPSTSASSSPSLLFTRAKMAPESVAHIA